jgi:hypothetical protein
MSGSSVSIKDVQLGIHLTAANALAWVQRMTHMLKARKLWSVVEETSPAEQDAHNARFAIACNVGDDLLHIIADDKTPKEIWEKLTKQFMGVSTARQLHLVNAQSKLSRSADESLADFITRATTLRMELASAKSLDDHQFSLAFHYALTDECENWVMSQKTNNGLKLLTKNCLL